MQQLLKWVFGRRARTISLGEPALRLTREGIDRGDRGDVEGAIARFEQALSIDPAHTPAHIGLAWAHRHLRDYRRALDVLSRAPVTARIGGAAVDFGFEIASSRVAVLAEQWRLERSQECLRALEPLLEEALALGRRPEEASSTKDELERAIGMDTASRASRIEALENMLDEVRRFIGSPVGTPSAA